MMRVKSRIKSSKELHSCTWSLGKGVKELACLHALAQTSGKVPMKKVLHHLRFFP